ncbi:MAG: hypothetical protein AAGA57_07680 [Planctomycetota bacterium]
MDASTQSIPDSGLLPDVPTEAVSDDRSERLRRVKLLVDSGLYETPERLDAALERLSDALSEG